VTLAAYIGPKQETDIAQESDFASSDEERQLADDVEKNDVRFLMPEHMPRYLRIDKDIKANLVILSKLAKQYS
jgi:hypothetical protein